MPKPKLTDEEKETEKHLNALLGIQMLDVVDKVREAVAAYDSYRNIFDQMKKPDDEWYINLINHVHSSSFSDDFDMFLQMLQDSDDGDMRCPQ